MTLTKTRSKRMALVIIAGIAAIAMCIWVALTLSSPAVDQSAGEDVIRDAVEKIKTKALHAPEVDWERVKSESIDLFNKSRNERSLDSALELLIQSLADGHSSYIPKKLLEHMTANQVQGANTLFERTNSEKGILSIRLHTYTVLNESDISRDAKHLAAEVLSTPNACGVLIDLRTNGGGNMWPMLSGLAPILGNRTLFSFRDGYGNTTEVAAHNGNVTLAKRAVMPEQQGVDGAQWAPPVAVLIGPNTASSGEFVAAALRAVTPSILIGETTAGLTSGNEVVKLKNGAAFALTTSLLINSTGKKIVGGISPDIEVDSSGEGDEATRKAYEWLKRHCAADKTLS